MTSDSYEPKTDVQKLVVCYKLCKGVTRDDRAWDKLNFRRFTKPAAALLEFFGGDLRTAGICMEEIGERLDKAALTWTLETVLKHASDWKEKNKCSTAPSS